MSTRTERGASDGAGENSLLVEAMNKLESISRDVPMDVTLTHLQLVVERLTFSGLADREVQNDQATKAEIELFFHGEVSEGMVAFIHWMAGKQMLRALTGNTGRIFLDYCNRTYRKIEEVIFTSAIELDADYRDAITERLRAVHPKPARILFRVQPALMAGFVIEDRRKTVDRSLRTHVATTVSRKAQLRSIAEEQPARTGSTEPAPQKAPPEEAPQSKTPPRSRFGEDRNAGDVAPKNEGAL